MLVNSQVILRHALASSVLGLLHVQEVQVSCLSGCIRATIQKYGGGKLVNLFLVVNVLIYFFFFLCGCIFEAAENMRHV